MAKRTVSKTSSFVMSGRMPRKAEARALAGTIVMVLGLLGGSAAQAAAPDLPTKPVLTLAVAQRVAAAAQREAESLHTPGVIAVVDDSGEVIVQIRMDNAYMRASGSLAPQKARSAVEFRRPTAVLETAIGGARPALITARGFVMMKGGEPIFVKDQLVGGIGISVDTPDHDEQIAQAGLAALK